MVCNEGEHLQLRQMVAGTATERTGGTIGANAVQLVWSLPELPAGRPSCLLRSPIR